MTVEYILPNTECSHKCYAQVTVIPPVYSLICGHSNTGQHRPPNLPLYSFLYPTSLNPSLSALHALSISSLFGSTTLTPICPNRMYLAAISLCSPPAKTTPRLSKFGRISGGVRPSGRYIAVMPLAWFSGFVASCFRPRSATVCFTFLEAARWSAKRWSSGRERICEREVWSAWISCGEGVAK